MHVYNNMLFKNVCAILFYVLPSVHFVSFVASQRGNEKSLATSISGMVQLLDVEMQLIHCMESYADALQEKVNTLLNLVRELKEENAKSLRNPEQYLSNPLNSFTLIRRLQHDWPLFELYMDKPVGDAYLSVIQKYRKNMPTYVDLKEASEAISRLQTVYDFKAADMARGILNGKQYDAKWKSVDSYFMGSYLLGQDLVYPSGFWLYAAVVHYEADSSLNKVIGFGKEKSLELYAENLLRQNRPQDALDSISLAIELKPMNAWLVNRRNEVQQEINKNNGTAIKYPVQVPGGYELGCRGHFANKPSTQYCIYNTTTMPFLRLAPIKMEILHTNPYIVLFHDVLTEREIEHLKNLAKPNLRRATVYNVEENRSEVVQSRTSQFSWFEDDTDEITKRINRRISDMTGFDLNGSEKLQVVNYGIGGHYDLHYDFFNISHKNISVYGATSDRIATVLFYLSDVEQGGATVFPNIETAVFPRKGSAVFWYNLDNEVKGDPLTLHAACPVIVGSKWVCNKWIHHHAQAFRKPCYK